MGQYVASLKEHDRGAVSQSWVLPVKYGELSPGEQTETLRGAILAYLKVQGRAAKSVLKANIQPPRMDTFQKALDFLTTTQQIYLDQAGGSRDPVYYSNGRLAHPLGQDELVLGPNVYQIAAFDDRLAGKTVTLTQYALLPSGDRKPISGIRLDWQDLPAIIDLLSNAADSLHINNGLVNYDA